MPAVIEYARAKINLSLAVLGRREDGYHALSSIVAFVDVADRLEIALAPRNTLAVSGRFAADVPLGEDNSLWKAWGHLNSLMPLPQVSVALEKNLPVASGIGGGSADAAAMLQGLLKLVGKTLDAAQITALAKGLGADVPVCFVGKPALMEGIGEKVTPLDEQLPPALVLVNPLVPCSTVAVFNAMGLKPGEMSPKPGAAWRNDMTKAAVSVQPVIAAVLSALEKTPLWPVLMSGSGATCFGVARSFEEAAAQAQELQRLHPGWWVRPARIISN